MLQVKSRSLNDNSTAIVTWSWMVALTYGVGDRKATSLRQKPAAAAAIGQTSPRTLVPQSAEHDANQQEATTPSTTMI
eukprot:223957-Amphidinium_carterae.1